MKQYLSPSCFDGPAGTALQLRASIRERAVPRRLHDVESVQPFLKRVFNEDKGDLYEG